MNEAIKHEFEYLVDSAYEERWTQCSHSFILLRYSFVFSYCRASRVNCLPLRLCLSFVKVSGKHPHPGRPQHLGQPNHFVGSRPTFSTKLEPYFAGFTDKRPGQFAGETLSLWWPGVGMKPMEADRYCWVFGYFSFALLQVCRTPLWRPLKKAYVSLMLRFLQSSEASEGLQYCRSYS